MASEEGQAALGRILLAFSVHKPKIGYCQSMNYIAALLLLILEKNEENTFWVLVSLIDDGGMSQPDESYLNVGALMCCLEPFPGIFQDLDIIRACL